MNPKKPNWHLWTGFVLSLIALLVYFIWVTTTRSVFWLSVALFAAALVFLISGLWRAYGQAEIYRGKIAGPILTVCLALMMGIFGLSAWVVSKAFPAAHNAPRTGQKLLSSCWLTPPVIRYPWRNCFPVPSWMLPALPVR